ncbi:ribonuclease HIII [Oceanobacillus oncorhynchi subsp. incaldanensis]|uniref:Ribonuclease HIII n=1 Tax=Oceanobacillus oncorhynchi TaxID=545501 RepID=A0A0A1MLK0_9BACI|nr:ribonuclease HIII [Oceanobacillus oncorhynchi]MDM8100511.1 ribonuclease HIII [Oceanobacillus oncorhynchi]GIO16998.1 ribonuclease HIII [Oceanobacillus oncorhynchi subsp. incaldanensis]CEI83948.1 Ribonuclease HIII [Oceanobacillus oncorhynchi]
MGQEVLTTSADKIKQMKKHYHTYLQKTPQGAVFRAKTPYAVITAYHSGKVLFQGSQPEKESTQWKDASASTQAAKAKPSSSVDTAIFQKSHIGSDESGTGDYFGPITVAAVFADKAQQVQLKQLGVEDSKHLKDDAIHRIAQEIIQLPISYTILKLENEKYNRLQLKGWSQGKMKAMLHHHAIDKLIKKLDGTDYDGIVIDQFCEPAVYKRYLQSEALKLHEKTTFITKAESHSINVAAASILARARFVTAMDKLSQEAGITLPKGASGKVDKAAANYIKAHGEQQLGHVAKLHFANTNKAKKYLH